MPAAPLSPRVWLAPGLAAVLVLALAFPAWTARETLAGQAAVVATVWAGCVGLLALREGAYAAATVYLVIFGLFHNGLLIAVALSDDLAARLPQIDWLYSPYLAPATTLVVLGMLAFTLATVLVTRGRAAPPVDVPEPSIGPSEDRARRVAGVVGLVVQAAGLALLLVAVDQAGGIGALSGGYGNLFTELNGSSAMAYGTLFIGIGTVLGVVAGGRQRVIAWSAFAAYAVVAFPLGTRGPVLFPLAVLVVIEARRGCRLRLPFAGAGVLMVTTLIAVVRTTRNDGIAGLLNHSWAVSPLEAVAEMGYSLRPSVVVLGWHGEGEPLRGGITLVAVVIRAFERLIGWPGGPPDVDDRLFNQEIFTRVGPIGGSPIAEGYHNLGLVGAVVMMFAIGTAIGVLSRRPSGLYPDAILAVVVLPLFVEIRNSFAVVLPQIGVGLAVLLAIRIVAGRPSTKARRAPPLLGQRAPAKEVAR